MPFERARSCRKHGNHRPNPLGTGHLPRPIVDGRVVAQISHKVTLLNQIDSS